MVLPHPATLHAQLRFAQASCRLFVFVGGEMLSRAGWQHSLHKLPGTSTLKVEVPTPRPVPSPAAVRAQMRHFLLSPTGNQPFLVFSSVTSITPEAPVLAVCRSRASGMAGADISSPSCCLGMR